MKITAVFKMKKVIAKMIVTGVAASFMISCDKYLDVLPDDIANLDHVFANKKSAEQYLATLYSYAPIIHWDNLRTLTFFGGDDLWTYSDADNYNRSPGLRIAMGQQNTSNPYENYWDGNMFKAIRDCNIFIEEIEVNQRVPELDVISRNRWLAEAKFMKAYYHFLLFRMYGPIPIIDKNLPISSDVDEVAVKRDPVDDVVNYLSNLLDEAAENLPERIDNSVEEDGRAIKSAAYMLKARVWLTAASPLFNGNSDYANFKDHDGVTLFPTTYDQTKWQKAVEACEQAIAVLPDSKLYNFTMSANISDRTRLQMNLRGAVTDRFNSEIIWGRYMRPYQNIVMQAECSVPQMNSSVVNAFQSSCYSVTMNMIERFYTKNGVPIDEDNEWDYDERYTPRAANEDQKYNLIPNYETAVMNQDREERFYASVMFDGCVVFMKNCTNTSDENAHQIKARRGELNQSSGAGRTTVTGYWIRKLINWEYVHSSSGATTRTYSWPEMRLADLKLMYAEALNEVDRRDEAIRQVDEIRDRVGLKGIKESWTQYSKNPGKPNTKEGLREIIHQEREIELAFEGHRLWDMKRWKKSEEYMNRNVTGWNYVGKTPSEYYQLNKVFEQKFVAPRDYLWPLSISSLLRNQNLVQNPGW